MAGLSDGEIPETNLQAIFLYIVMLLGLIMFATVIGSVSALEDDVESAKIEFTNRVSNSLL